MVSSKIKTIPALPCIVVVLPLISWVVSWGETMQAEDAVVVRGAQTKLPDNVRVLGVFEEQNYTFDRNVKELHRSPRILARRIAEYVTKQRMPDSPPPPTQPAVPMNDANSPNVPPVIPPPVFELLPVAWSFKTVNLTTSFLPQMREEVIVLVRYTPEYFASNCFANGQWVLAHLRNAVNDNDIDPSEDDPFPSDSLGRWEIALTPELLDKGPPESSRLNKTASIRSYKARPTMEQISEFVYSTDFGNNDMFRHALGSHRMNVNVVQVVVYPDYAALANLFREGLKTETIAQRRAAYQESDRRNAIQPEGQRRRD